MALARPPVADREGTGDIVLSRRPLLGRRATTARLACCSRCVRGKSRGERGRCRPEGVAHPATQAFCQVADDPKPATGLDPSEARSVIGDSAVHPGTGTHQLDFDSAVAAIKTGV